MLHCGTCNRIIMDRTKDGWKLRTRMLLLSDDGRTMAICPSCKTEVPVPVLMGAHVEHVALPKSVLYLKG